MWDDYVWILVLTSLLGFCAAFGLGANDVANAFATSVGAKSITLPQAIVIAGIFEFAGAVLLGADVTGTISHGLVDVKDFEDAPEILMYGMLCVVAAASIWLLLACYLELPVSSTHSVVGGIIGFAVVAHGWDTINWYEFNDSASFLKKFKGVAPILVSWITSPLLSGIIASLMFFLVRMFILRKENSLERSFRFFPLLVGVACLVNFYFILLVGFDKRRVKHDGKKESISDILGTGWASLIAWVLAGIITLIIQFTFVPWLKERTTELAQIRRTEGEEGPSEDASLVGKEEGGMKKNESWLSFVSSAIDKDIHGALETDETVRTIHDKSEKFDPITEISFSYLQVFTAACVSFAHGANDVANSIGPLAAVFYIYKHSQVAKDSNVPLWILVIGASGIVAGLASFGFIIIRAIGVKLVKISPARGFSMEFATAVVITVGSIYGIPLSTTHCQVGSTTAVGLLEGVEGVNGFILVKVIVGWVATLVVVGLTSAMFFAQGIYAPSKLNIDALHRYEEGVNEAIKIATAYDPSTTEAEASQKVAEFVHDKEDNSASQIGFLLDMLNNFSCSNTTE